MLFFRKYLVSFILIFCGNAEGEVNCSQENVTLKNQHEIDSFQLDYGICDVLLGSLTVRESVDSNIKDLVGLAGLEVIKGNLIIESNDELRSLEGLNSLSSIGSNLTISSNSNLSDLSSLSNLKQVSGIVLIDSNDTLASLAGIENLMQIAKLRIRNNDALTELMPFSDLFGLEELDFYNNDSLPSLSAFPNLSNVSSTTRIQGNDDLTDIEGLRKLFFVGGDLEISNNLSLSSLSGLEGLQSISGDLKVFGNTQLQDCGALIFLLGWPDSEDGVGGTISISDNKSGCNSQVDSLSKSPYNSPNKYRAHGSICRAVQPVNSITLQSKETGLTNTNQTLSIDIICPVPHPSLSALYSTNSILFDIELQAQNASTSENTEELECLLSRVDGKSTNSPKPKRVAMPSYEVVQIKWGKVLSGKGYSGHVLYCELPAAAAISQISSQSIFASEINHSVGWTDISNAAFKNRSGDCASYTNIYTGTVLNVGLEKFYSLSLKITASEEQCEIQTNGIPNHDFNDSSTSFVHEVSSIDRSFSIPRRPFFSNLNTELSQNSWDAIMLNGVVVDLLSAGCYRPNAPEANSDGNVQTGCQLNEETWLLDPLATNNDFGTDSHNAHTQPDGTYHYHGNPLAMFELSDSEEISPVIGFAADGFPIYGSYFLDNGEIRKALSSYRLRDNGGARPAKDDENPGGTYDGTYIQDYEYIQGTGDLDECNGMSVNGQYGYYVTDAYPWILNCFKGYTDESFRK